MSIANIIQFLKDDIWRIRLNDLPAKKSVLIKYLRILLIAFKGFNDDKCSLRASALTFYSLLSVIPAAALAFGISKGFGMQKVLEKALYKSMKGQQEIVEKVIFFADEWLQQTRGGLIAIIGVFLLILIIIKLLGNVEESFNDIWGAPHSRTFSRKMSDYLSVLFIAPILFILSSSATVIINNKIKDQIAMIMERFDLLGHVSTLIFFSLEILPFCVIWLLLTFVYMFMPNTRVRFWSGFMGGFVAGTILVIVQTLYITFQIGVSQYGAIYGSFAVLPLFMAWLQVSWLIVLFGAEITFAHQNVDTYEMGSLYENTTYSLKKTLSLRITNICIKKFINGSDPLSAKKIAETLELPVRLTNKLLSDLVKCHVLSETFGEDEKIEYYQPARGVNTLTIHYVSKALEKLGDEDITFRDSEEIKKIKGSFEKLDALISKSDANIMLKDI